VGGSVAVRGVYRVLVGQPVEKILLGRSRRRCVDYIRMDLWERGRMVSLWGNSRQRDIWGDLGLGGWIILKCI
jgi:hypothetical protein